MADTPEPEATKPKAAADAPDAPTALFAIGIALFLVGIAASAGAALMSNTGSIYATNVSFDAIATRLVTAVLAAGALTSGSACMAGGAVVNYLFRVHRV